MAAKKTLKGIRWKKDSPIKGSLNEIAEDRVVRFCEKQEDGTQDIVDFEFKIQEDQYGGYAEEYLPNTLEKTGHNVIDVTAFILDETNKKGKWYLLDVKKNVGGEDVIFHLIDQWKSSYTYLKNDILNYVNEVNFQENIGVVTRGFDYQRIETAIEKKRKIIDSSNSLLNSIAGAKKRNDNIRLKQEIKCLEDFQSGIFVYKDKYENRNFNYFVFLEKTDNKNDYYEKISLLLTDYNE